MERLFYSVLNRDHPRVCGEKLRDKIRNTIAKGSPPRVRGKVNGGPAYGNRSRITPACAGKSETDQAVEAANQDHPRVCGEKTKESLKK